jgi:hypothetical protein
MKTIEKDEILKNSVDSYIVVRDEDWEILCMISREDWGYSAYTLEQYVLLKEDVYKILDKAAGIELIDKVDTDIAEQYKDEAMIEKYLEKTEE